MDILTKVICKYGISTNTPTIREYEIDLKKYPNGNLGTQFIEFTEHMKVEITYLCDDETSVLEIENYESDDLKCLKSGETVILSPGGENDDMLIPGYYSIKIRTFSRDYNGFYRVKPSSIDWNGLLNIRKYLEKIVRGLSYNIYAERNGHTNSKCNYHDAFLFEMYKYIESNWYDFTSSVEFISKNPILDIYKEYNKKSYTKNPDSKSQRWLCKRGQTYNFTSCKINNYYEKHSKVTYNTFENKVVKKILEYIYNVLVILNNEFFNIKSQILNEVQQLEIKKQKLNEKYNSKKSILNIEKARNDISKEIESIRNREEEHKTYLESINEYCNKIKKMKNLVSHYKNETFINEVADTNTSIKPNNKLLKNKYYFKIYEIYRNLSGMKLEGNEDNMFPHKKTSKLLEIYCFILVKDILETLGFIWVDGWLKKIDNILSYHGDLLSNDIILLTKDQYKIELVYDKEYNLSSNINNSNVSQLVALKSGSSRRPDITLMLYKNDKFLRGLILEVKCRKKKYIYKEDVQTDVMYQLIDYANNLKYYDGENKKVNLKDSGITKVIVLYPKQHGKCKFKDNLYEFPFIQVEPTDLNEKPYGYDELYEEIVDFINFN